jgi:hypothetical protein
MSANACKKGSKQKKPPFFYKKWAFIITLNTRPLGVVKQINGGRLNPESNLYDFLGKKIKP